MKKIIIATLFFILLFILINLSKNISAYFGNYLILNGGFVSAKNTDNSPLNAFTFEAYIKPNEVSGIQKIFSIGDLSLNRVYYEIGINGGSLSFLIRYNNGSLLSAVSGNLISNQWSHVAVTTDINKTTLFINGEKIMDIVGTFNLAKAGPDIILGKSLSSGIFSSNEFYGEIDYIRVSSVSRDIGSLWNGGAYNNPLTADQNTLLLWNLDGIRGQNEAIDSSSNQLNGIFNGGDSKIHYFGILPSPTPFVLPTSRWTRPVLPTLSIPTIFLNRSSTPTISAQIPSITPIPTNQINYPRPTRPFRISI
jgi:hypothetical protein